VSALLGSCSETIQPVISSALTSHAAWERLTATYANSSRGRIVSLKAKLAKNFKAGRSIAEFLLDMQSIADDLALAQSPISEEDLVVHIIMQLGDEYNPIVSALRVRESAISLSALRDILTDHERLLKDNDAAQQGLIATANFTHRQQSHGRSSPGSFARRGNNSARRGRGAAYGNNMRQLVCKFCDIPGYETRHCRKLVRFLREHNVSTPPVPD